MFEPELGQFIKDEQYEQHDALWAIHGLHVIADTVDPKNLGYGVKIDTPVFTMRMYNWEDCACPNDDEHTNNCPEAEPHFYHKPSGLGIRWYKYIGRGLSANHPEPDNWGAVVTDCLVSLRREE